MSTKNTYTVRLEWDVTYFLDVEGVEAGSPAEAAEIAMEDPDYDNQESYDDAGDTHVARVIDDATGQRYSETGDEIGLDGKPVKTAAADTKIDHAFSVDDAERKVLETVQRTFDEADLARFLSECHPGETVRVGETICRCDPETLEVAYLDK